VWVAASRSDEADTCTKTGTPRALLVGLPFQSGRPSLPAEKGNGGVWHKRPAIPGRVTRLGQSDE
jgi:hypothetical protein